MHKHIYIVYIPAQSTSYFQPCDVAMFRTWKSVLAAAANESFAESVVGYQDFVRLLSHAPEAWCGQRRRRSTFRTESSSGEEDESAAAPYSSSVTGAAIKRKRTFDKLLALRIVCGKGPKGQACWLRPAQSKETLS